MKFDVVIGNPPYQINDGGKRTDGTISSSASPIYPAFVESAVKISHMQSLIIPARWTTGAGKGLSHFSEYMLNKKNIMHFSYYTESQDVFPDNLIRGGVSHFVMKADYNGPANVSVNFRGETHISTRYLDENKIGLFVPFYELSSILNKVKKKESLKLRNMQSIVSVRNPYGIGTDFFNNPSKYNVEEIEMERNNSDDIKVNGLYKRSRTIRYIKSDYPLEKGAELLDKYKVFLPYASGGEGLNGKEPILVLGETIIGDLYNISTETYLNVGSFNTRIEAENLNRYIKTKFLQVLIMVLKSTQHVTKTFKFVPLQDFTEYSDIDWTQSIAGIDQQLYKKYGLNEEEIEFIETNIKEME